MFGNAGHDGGDLLAPGCSLLFLVLSLLSGGESRPELRPVWERIIF
jgi:hypothetical protein